MASQPRPRLRPDAVKTGSFEPYSCNFLCFHIPPVLRAVLPPLVPSAFKPNLNPSVRPGLLWRAPSVAIYPSGWRGPAVLQVAASPPQVVTLMIMCVCFMNEKCVFWCTDLVKILHMNELKFFKLSVFF